MRRLHSLPYPLLLLLYCLALYIPGQMALPPTDRDESRFAQASKQMLETGDYIDIRFQDTPRYKKPAGVYWLQAAAVKAVQAVADVSLNTIWLYRLPSLLAAIGSVLLLYGIARALALTREQAFTAALLLASTVLLNIEAHLAKTDACLLLTIIAQQGALAVLYTAAKQQRPINTAWWRLLFWAALGAGMLIKGFVNPAIAALTLLTLRYYYQEKGLFVSLKPWWGVGLALLFILPWFLAIQHLSNGQFATQAIGHDFAGKLHSGQESHGAWPGYYLLLAPFLFWPASLLFGGAVKALWQQRQTTSPLLRFCVAWLVPSWLLFELIPTKLPHYILPLLPALCLLGAVVPMMRPRWLTALWASGGLALGGAAVWLPYHLNGAVSVAGVVVALGCLAIVFIARTPKQLALLAVLIFPFVFWGVLPSLTPAWLSKTLAEKAGGMPLVSVGYSEPSLVFLAGTNTRFTTAEQAFATVEGCGTTLYAIKKEQISSFEKAATAQGVSVQPDKQPLKGFNYSTGKWIEMSLFKAGMPCKNGTQQN